jgi:hypothetical protein
VMNPQSRAKRNVGLPKHLQKDYVLPSWKKWVLEYISYMSHY